MRYKHSCVLDADHKYKTLVLVRVDADPETGGDRETVLHYALQAGETLAEATPPALRPYAGASGYVAPAWGKDCGWTEAATDAEIAAWEAEHPAPKADQTETQRLRAQLATLETQLTDLQMALCDVYELAAASMGGESDG